MKWRASGGLVVALAVGPVLGGCGGERVSSSQASPADAQSVAATAQADNPVSKSTSPDAPGAPGAADAVRDLVFAAQKAEHAGDMAGCIRNEQAALALRENARNRLRLASCESRAGKLVAAYANMSTARDLARHTSDPDTERAASARADELEKRLPTIEVELDAATSATLDGEPLADRSASMVDPGSHELVVTFVSAATTKTITVAERDSVNLVADAQTQTIAPAPPRPTRRMDAFLGGF